MIKMPEQAGKTTIAIKATPLGAFYLVAGRDVYYCVDLAHKLGRKDIKIITECEIEKGRFRGSRNQIVLDHACYGRISDRALAEIVQHNSVIELSRPPVN
jgi:hypothetical protein